MQKFAAIFLLTKLKTGNIHLCYTELRIPQGAAIQKDLHPKITPFRERAFSLLNEKDPLCGQVMTVKYKHRGASSLQKPLEKQESNGVGGKSVQGFSCLVITLWKCYSYKQSCP